MHKIIFFILTGFLAFLNADSTIKPSFDCNKAKTKVEKAICSDSKLAKLDNDMKKTFDIVTGKHDLAYMDEASQNELRSYFKAIKKDQIRWLKSRNECEKDKDIISCVKSKYRYRINSFFAGYDPDEGIVLNDQDGDSDLCLNYLTQKLWMDSPKPVNQDNLAFDNNEKFYDSVFKNKSSEAKLLKDKQKQEKNYEKYNIKNNFAYTNLEYTSFGKFVMCIDVQGENKELYSLYGGTFRPYCVSYMNKFIDEYESNPAKLYPVEYEEALKELKQKGEDIDSDEKEFEATLLKKIVKNHGNFANEVYESLPAEDLPVDIKMLSLQYNIVTLYASYHDEDRYKFGAYKSTRGEKKEYLPGLIVSDPFFFRLYGFEYSYTEPKLLCRLPVQSRFVDVNNLQTVKSYFNKFKGL